VSIKDMAEKIKGTVIPKDVKKEDFEVTEDEKKEITENNVPENEDKPISDEVEDIVEDANNVSEDNQNEEPIKIKTMFVKAEDENTPETAKDKIKGAAKIAAGVGIAAIGLAAVLLRSKKRR